MPIVIALGALLVFFILLVLSIPLSVIQRYRAGTRRRKARGCLVSANLLVVALSTLMFLVTAAIVSLRAPDALLWSLSGLAVGALLGFLGVALSRWERSDGGVHYTPSRILILMITVVITVRIGYGIHRAWTAWMQSGSESWFVASGIGQSLGFGAIVLGYYLAYWAGVRGRLRSDS